MKIGYAYWGYLGDVKYNEKGEVVSTPDGNAFYSWSIIHSLIIRGNEVWQMMPNRDRYCLNVKENFSGMGFDEDVNPRYVSYINMKKYLYNDISDWSEVSEKQLYKIWDKNGINKLDAILLEWRMEVPGRNTMDARGNDNWQPDLFIQDAIIRYCGKNKIKLLIFDLDYKLSTRALSDMVEANGVDYYILELGYKWKGLRAKHVEIPFDFNYIDNYPICDSFKNLVYVGNRYERDKYIDKYIPTDLDGVDIYGNWLEGGRDSAERWPDINFHERIGIRKMRNVYSRSACTILLAKDEYLKNGFMTARIIESIFYGTIPLFIEEYGKEIINKYAGIFDEDLTVRSKEDVVRKCKHYSENKWERLIVIKYLRERLQFMDVSNFTNILERVVEK